MEYEYDFAGDWYDERDQFDEEYPLDDGPQAGEVTS